MVSNEPFIEGALVRYTNSIVAPGISETTLSDLELYARFSSAAYCASENGVVDTIVKSGSSHDVVEAQEFRYANI